MPAQEKIRVLIVDDIAETRENIRRMLQFDSAIEVVGTARTGREAIEQAQQSISPMSSSWTSICRIWTALPPRRR